MVNPVDAARPVPSLEPLRRRRRLLDVSRRTLVTCGVVVALLVLGGLLLVRTLDPGQTDATFINPQPTATSTPSPATSPGTPPAPLARAGGRCPQASDGTIGGDPLTPTLPGNSPRIEPSPTKPRMQVCPATG
jgi:hypothetical protein